jgi:ABC-2 type transport system permease protein
VNALVRLALLRLIRDRAALVLTVGTAPLFALGYAGFDAAPQGYLASLLVFSVLMSQFSAAVAAAKERETGTLLLLLATPQPIARLATAMMLPHLLTAALSHALTLLVAAGTGALPQTAPKSVAITLLVCVAGSCASSGVGFAVAAFTRTLIHAFLLTSLLMFLQLLCAGLLFPAPDHPLDALLPTHPLRQAVAGQLGLGPAAGARVALALAAHALLLPAIGSTLLVARTRAAVGDRA